MNEPFFPVHDDVDGGVDDDAGDGGTAGHVGAADPPEEEHGAVVVDVEERQVRVLASQREEYRVLKVDSNYNLGCPVIRDILLCFSLCVFRVCSDGRKLQFRPTSRGNFQKCN